MLVMIASSSPLKCDLLRTLSLVPTTRVGKHRLALAVIRSQAGAGGARDFGGELVDENMIVLRKRIHDMKVAEQSYEPPSDWMEWEKQYYWDTYSSDVTMFLGMVQTLLLNSRPMVAVAAAGILTLAVPTAVVWMVLRFLEVVSVGFTCCQ